MALRSRKTDSPDSDTQQTEAHAQLAGGVAFFSAGAAVWANPQVATQARASRQIVFKCFIIIFLLLFYPGLIESDW